MAGVANPRRCPNNVGAPGTHACEEPSLLQPQLSVAESYLVQTKVRWRAQSAAEATSPPMAAQYDVGKLKMHSFREPYGYSRQVTPIILNNDVSNRYMHYSREPCGYSNRVIPIIRANDVSNRKMHYSRET